MPFPPPLPAACVVAAVGDGPATAEPSRGHLRAPGPRVHLHRRHDGPQACIALHHSFTGINKETSEGDARVKCYMQMQSGRAPARGRHALPATRAHARLPQAGASVCICARVHRGSLLGSSCGRSGSSHDLATLAASALQCGRRAPHSSPPPPPRARHVTHHHHAQTACTDSKRSMPRSALQEAHARATVM